MSTVTKKAAAPATKPQEASLVQGFVNQVAKRSADVRTSGVVISASYSAAKLGWAMSSERAEKREEALLVTASNELLAYLQ